jgi:co-chaperonin GroES (HSP10)
MSQLVRLLTDRVHVRLDPRKEKTSGGLLIPETTAQAVRTGVVLHVGPGRYVKVRRRGTQDYREVLRSTVVTPGERVAFFIASVDTKTGKAVSHYLQEDERVIREDDILFVFDEGTDVEVTL